MSEATETRQYDNPPLTGTNFKDGPITFTFDETDNFPFYEKENVYDGKKTMKYGYKICNAKREIDGSQIDIPNDTIFFTQTAKDIIDAAKCKRNQTVTMHLKSGQKKDGGLYTVWILDDKSRNQWLEESATPASVDAPKEPVVEENVEAPVSVDFTKVVSCIDAVEDAIKDLKSEIDSLHKQLNPKPKDDINLPF